MRPRRLCRRVAGQPSAIPIIDTHIHSSIRPVRKGAPYSGPKNAGPPVPALPARYRALAGPLGAVGAIKVEASPWIEDNLWVLEVAQQDPDHRRRRRQSRAREAGVCRVSRRATPRTRCSAASVAATSGAAISRLRSKSPAFIDGLKRLADADLVMDTANPRLSLLQAVVRVTDKVPTLRVVLDHLPALAPFETAADRDALDAVLRELGARPQVYVKLSAIIHSVQGRSRPSCSLPERARPADGGLRRGSRDLRQRLAEQRRRRPGRQGVRGREGVLRDQTQTDGREGTSGETPSPPTSGSSATRLSRVSESAVSLYLERCAIAMRTLLLVCVSVVTVRRAGVRLASRGEQGAKPAKAVPLFDGKTFNGWEGDLKIFRIEDGAIVAGTLDNKIARNEFLCTTQTYGDFELRLKVKLLGGDNANAGIQFRTKRIPNHHEVTGYQADMGVGWWGALYDESRRNKVLTGPDQAKMKDVVKAGDWNDYVIRAEGKRIQLWINGFQTVDYTEDDPQIEATGVIAVQIHSGPPSQAWYKDITIVNLTQVDGLRDCPRLDSECRTLLRRSIASLRSPSRALPRAVPAPLPPPSSRSQPHVHGVPVRHRGVRTRRRACCRASSTRRSTKWTGSIG